MKVLILGQTPPPFGGQAVMIDAIVRSSRQGFQKFHVRFAYSRVLADVGTVRAAKVFELARVIWASLKILIRHRPDLLYYSSGGPNLVPVLRDLITLIVVRPMVKKTVFHFHAAGIADEYERVFQRHYILRRVFQRAFFFADAAILPSRSSPRDPVILKALSVYHIPNGVRDVARRGHRRVREAGPDPLVLFVGAIRQSKGVFDLIEACVRLWDEGLRFRLQLMGSGTEQLLQEIRRNCGRYWIYVDLLGEQVGDDKWEYYRGADLFCFPSLFETFGLAVVEAMMHELPVVATRAGGLSEVVLDGETGYLVDVHDITGLSARMKQLLGDRALARKLGERGREMYLERYDLKTYLDRVHGVFQAVFDRTDSGR